jgi:hypothetical protein
VAPILDRPRPVTAQLGAAPVSAARSNALSRTRGPLGTRPDSAGRPRQTGAPLASPAEPRARPSIDRHARSDFSTRAAGSSHAEPDVLIGAAGLGAHQARAR